MPGNPPPAAAAGGNTDRAYVLPPTIKISEFHCDENTDGAFTITKFIEDVDKATAMN